MIIEIKSSIYIIKLYRYCIFMQPQPPSKRSIIKSTGLTYPKLKTAQLNKVQNMKYESNQQLADLQVECLNKDKTIQEHEKHIEDMKDEMRKLETELEELRNKQNEIETQHMKDIETMVNIIFLNRNFSYYRLMLSICYMFKIFLICRVNCNMM